MYMENKNTDPNHQIPFTQTTPLTSQPSTPQTFLKLEKVSNPLKNNKIILVTSLIMVLLSLTIFGIFAFQQKISSTNQQQLQDPTHVTTNSTNTPPTTPTLTSTTASAESDLSSNLTPLLINHQEESNRYTSEEFGISFWMPESFYWNGGRSTKGEGAFTTPYILGENTQIVKDVGKISCNLIGEFLKNPSNCTDGEEIEYLMVNYLDPTTSNYIPVFMVSAPSSISFENSIGCSDCKFWYDQDVNILGSTYKVKVYYSLNSSGQRLTEGIQLEGLVLANSKSKWKYFGIEPFIGFQDSDFIGPEVGLSQTSRKILESLEYIN